MADEEYDDSAIEGSADPQSAIASILSQMQGAAQRSRPLETIENANRAMPRRQLTDFEEYARHLGPPGVEGHDKDELSALLQQLLSRQ